MDAACAAAEAATGGFVNAGQIYTSVERGRGDGVGVIRCFFRASLIPYVTAFAPFRRSGMSRSTRNTLSSAPSFSVLFPFTRTTFTTVVLSGGCAGVRGDLLIE